MESLESICFEIISYVGTARSLYIEAIREARKGNFDNSLKLIDEGNENFNKGHNAHSKLIFNEANGELEKVSLILIHAEDQLMSAESFKILSLEFVELYKSIKC